MAVNPVFAAAERGPECYGYHICNLKAAKKARTSQTRKDIELKKTTNLLKTMFAY
jgi:hypothetical protein